MAKPRPRYVVTGKLFANGVDLCGQEVIMLGAVTWSGRTRKDIPGLSPKELDHYRFRLEDKKFLRDHNLMAMNEFTLSQSRVDVFLSPKEDT